MPDRAAQQEGVSAVAGPGDAQVRGLASVGGLGAGCDKREIAQ
jgi:hypothetical protein